MTVTEADLVDYLADELSPERRNYVRQRLNADAALQATLAELRAVRDALATAQDPVPGTAADARFAAWLAGAAARPVSGTRSHPRPAALLGLAAGVLLLVFGLGWYFGRSTAEDRLAATRALMLELMQADRSTTRMRAATVSLDVQVADPAIIGQLGLMLRTDPNANVRLAALDALRRFSDDEATRRELLAALAAAPPAAVRVELMELLVRLGDRRVLPYLREIMDDDRSPRPLRDAAELGTFKLI